MKYWFNFWHVVLDDPVGKSLALPGFKSRQSHWSQKGGAFSHYVCSLVSHSQVKFSRQVLALAYFPIHRSSSMYVPFKLVWQICKRISRIQEPLFGLHSILRIVYICSPAWNFRSMFFHEKTFTNWIIDMIVFSQNLSTVSTFTQNTGTQFQFEPLRFQT